MVNKPQQTGICSYRFTMDVANIIARLREAETNAMYGNWEAVKVGLSFVLSKLNDRAFNNFFNTLSDVNIQYSRTGQTLSQGGETLLKFNTASDVRKAVEQLRYNIMTYCKNNDQNVENSRCKVSAKDIRTLADAIQDLSLLTWGARCRTSYTKDQTFSKIVNFYKQSGKIALPDYGFTRQALRQASTIKKQGD